MRFQHRLFDRLQRVFLYTRFPFIWVYFLCHLNFFLIDLQNEKRFPFVLQNRPQSYYSPRATFSVHRKTFVFSFRISAPVHSVGVLKRARLFGSRSQSPFTKYVHIAP